jgi:hypothetical protein
MPSVLYEVRLRPGVRPLIGVVSVLHARAADVTGMAYRVRSGRARLLLSINASSTDAELLARQLRRRVDVVEVRLREPLQARR